MAYLDFVCLAASLRVGGMCYAGKEVGTGRWVRPITSIQQPQIAHYDKVYAKNQPAEIGDVIRCPTLGAVPDEWQTENFIKGNERWTRIGQATYAQVSALCDQPACLWNTGSDSQNGQNDRVAVADAANMDHSLLLVRATEIVVMADPAGNGKLKHRVAFDYLGRRYDLSMTDPHMNLPAEGQHQIEDGLVCCSLPHRWTFDDGMESPYV